jgi:hypothetical protein
VLRRTLTAALVLGLLTGASVGEAKNPQATGGSSPTNTSLPSVSGSALIGATLTGSNGSWSPKGLKYSVQWLRCGTTCQPISTATTKAYVVGVDDASSTLRFQVIASNQSGSTIADSSATSAVPAAVLAPDTQPPTAPGPLSITTSSDTAVTVAWTPSTDNVAVAGYDVYQNGTSVTKTSSLTASLSGLTCATSYGVAVDAYDAAGNHSAISSVSAATSACPAPPSASGSIYWGAYIEGTQTYNYLYGGTWSNAPWCDPGTQCPLARFQQNAAKNPSIEHYGQPAPWLQGFDVGSANLVESRGDIPAIDMSTGSVSLSAIASGNYDSSITAWAQAAKSFGHPFFLVLDEEMNGTWYPYSPGQNGNTAASFVAAWRHMHDIFTSVGATNVTWVWCPNVDIDGVYTPFSQMYPGDAYVDWTGLNGYNWGGSQWMSFSQVFASSYANLLQIAPSKPIMIGETASAEDGGSKASWITDALGVQLPQKFPQIKAVLWFNWRVYEKSTWWPWEIESSASSQQAFANAISSSYYAPGGTFANLPLLSKVQPIT